MNIKCKDDDRIFYEICEQLEIRGECANNDNAFRTMVGFLKNLYDSFKKLEKENVKLRKKIALYEKNAVLLYRINQPTVPEDMVVGFLNTNNLQERIEEANKGRKYLKNQAVQSFEPTFKKPFGHIVTTHTTWCGCKCYEDALKKIRTTEECTIWELEWDKYKGDWKLVNGELYENEKYIDKLDFDYLHFQTLNGFLKNTTCM